MEKIKVMIEGGKATPGPPLGPALGPLGVSIGKVVEEINKKTKAFSRMQVPVTIKVNLATKEFDIEIGSPPVSSLIKKELNLEKGSPTPNTTKVADMVIEQVIKIAMMKESSLLTKDRKATVKCILGTCASMGILVEGKDPREVIKEVDQGIYDKKIEKGKTELTEEEKRMLEEKKKKLEEELRRELEVEEKKAHEIMDKLKGKSNAAIRTALKNAGISMTIINKLVPITEKGEDRKKNS